MMGLTGRFSEFQWFQALSCPVVCSTPMMSVRYAEMDGCTVLCGRGVWFHVVSEFLGVLIVPWCKIQVMRETALLWEGLNFWSRVL